MNQLSFFAKRLYAIQNTRENAFPPIPAVRLFIDGLLRVLFPHFQDKPLYASPEKILKELAQLQDILIRLLEPLQEKISHSPRETAVRFFDYLPEIFDQLILDAQAIYQGDPAAESEDEVIAAYPGFFAIYAYRMAHVFHSLQIPLLPRLISEYAHYKTGIDIHPAAKIGRSFCIDHGTGIVIGETTIIGNHVKIYQGVSLGALSVSKKLAKTKRHPTIEDNVIIYSNATILGGNTVIGHDSIIGGNVWLTQSVEPYSIVYNRFESRIRPKKIIENQIMFHI